LITDEAQGASFLKGTYMMQDVETLIKNKNDFLSRVNARLDPFRVKIYYSVGRTQFELCSETALSNAEMDETEEHDIDYNAPDPYAFVPFNRHIITMDLAPPGYHSCISFNEQDIVSVEKRCITKGKKQKVISEEYIVGFIDGTTQNTEQNRWEII
jgi:hypothetical protein